MTDRELEEGGVVVIIVIEFLKDRASRVLDTEVELRAGRRGSRKPDVTHALEPGAELPNRPLAVIDHDQFRAAIGLAEEASQGLLDETGSVPGSQDTGNQFRLAVG